MHDTLRVGLKTNALCYTHGLNFRVLKFPCLFLFQPHVKDRRACNLKLVKLFISDFHIDSLAG